MGKRSFTNGSSRRFVISRLERLILRQILHCCMVMARGTVPTSFRSRAPACAPYGSPTARFLSKASLSSVHPHSSRFLITLRLSFRFSNFISGSFFFSQLLSSVQIVSPNRIDAVSRRQYVRRGGPRTLMLGSARVRR